jgi:salicylate hydroxylase
MRAAAPRIAIVGAGIGGLTLGLLLRERGVDAHIYEQAPELREVGAAVALAANGTRVLRRLGLGELLAESSVEPTEVVYRHGETGDRIASFPMRSAYTARYGAEFFGIHRMHLQRILAEAWGHERLHLGSRVVDLEEDEDGVRLHLAGGGSAAADVVVGADGVRSVVRGWVTGGGPAPVYSGASGFRGLVPAERVRGLVDPLAIQLWLGPGGYVIHYPISGDMINFVVARPGPAPWPHPTWMTEEPPGTALAALETWHLAVRTLVGSVGQSPRWALFAMPPLQRWWRGHAVLLGDAAHAMLPHQGQGANQAVEDAAVLAAVLADADRAGIAAALRRYEVLRRPRTRQVQRSSWVNADMLRLHGGLDDRMLADLPERLDWIHGYDVADVLTPGAAHRTSMPGTTGADLLVS